MRNIIFLTSTSLTLPWEQLLSLQVVLVLYWVRKWSLRTETVAEQVYISYTQQACYHLTLQTGVLIFWAVHFDFGKSGSFPNPRYNNHTFSDYYVPNTHWNTHYKNTHYKKVCTKLSLPKTIYFYILIRYWLLFYKRMNCEMNHRVL